jgi:hypothetical protein
MRHRMRWALPLAGLVWLAPLAACAPDSPEVKPSGSSPAAASASPAASQATAHPFGKPAALALGGPDPHGPHRDRSARHGSGSAGAAHRGRWGGANPDRRGRRRLLPWGIGSALVRRSGGFPRGAHRGRVLRRGGARSVAGRGPAAAHSHLRTAGWSCAALPISANSVTEGSEPVDGQPATRIQGWLPAAGNIDGLGLTDAERAVVDGRPQARIAVTVSGSTKPGASSRCCAPWSRRTRSPPPAWCNCASSAQLPRSPRRRDRCDRAIGTPRPRYRNAATAQ